MEENLNTQPEIQNTGENQAPVNKLNSSAANGLKLAAISIIFGLLASFLPKNSFGTIMGIVITLCKLGATITFLWWAMKTYSAKNAAVNGFTTYGNVFSYGFLTSLFSGIALAAYTFISVTWISPDSLQAVRDAYLSQLESMPEAHTQTLEAILNNMETVSTVGALVMAIIYGLIFSSILASSTKVNPMSNFSNQ